jgi:small conductance mechanosensitive channel
MSSLLDLFHRLDEGWKLVLTHLGRIVVIVVIAWLLHALATRLIRVFRTYMADRLSSADETRRVATLERVFRYVATVVIAIVAGTLVLGELGVSVAPILATAGVAGVAIGFGAQSLVKDYFTGFFLLLEDQIRQGDVVTILDRSGVVEEVTLRYVRLRDGDGHVHYISNGEIKVLTNRTREFALVSVDVSVRLEESLEHVFEVMRQVGRELRADPQFAASIAEDLKVDGVENLSDSGVLLRCHLRVAPPTEQWAVKREFLKRLKAAFDASGIAFPQPRIALQPLPGRPADPTST